MPTSSYTDIRGIVFDLDGTLYASDRFAAKINDTAAAYVAGIRGTNQAEAVLLMAATRQRLAEASGTAQTLSAVSTELGGNVRELHSFFVQKLQPEEYLVPDERVVKLLERLAAQFSLYVYTNNNRVLADRIMTCLGLDTAVSRTFTIDDEWRGKPDQEMVNKVLKEIGLVPNEALFVGDRYDIDLRVPEQCGCPVYLSQTIEQLSRLEQLLIPA